MKEIMGKKINTFWAMCCSDSSIDYSINNGSKFILENIISMLIYILLLFADCCSISCNTDTLCNI